MKSTSRQVLQGSQTAARTQAIADIRAGGEAVRQVPATTLNSIVLKALKRDYEELGDAQTRAVASEMTRILTNTNPKDVYNIVQQLKTKTIADVIRRDIPELLPIIGRALSSSYVVGGQSGNLGSKASSLFGLSEIVAP